MMSTESFKFPVTAGAIIRGSIRRGLEEAAWHCDINLKIDEKRGWIDSRFLCTGTGEPSNITRFKAIMERWFLAIQKGNA